MEGHSVNVFRGKIHMDFNLARCRRPVKKRFGKTERLRLREREGEGAKKGGGGIKGDRVEREAGRR